MDEKNKKYLIMVLILLLFVAIVVSEIFIFQGVEGHNSINFPTRTTTTISISNITTTNGVSTTNTITTNSISTTNTIKTNSTIPKNITTTIIPTSKQNYTATFLAPNPVSHYFFYIPLSFNSITLLNQTCLGLEKAYYNQSNYSEIDNLLNSNNTSIFSNKGVEIVANYGNKLNESINQSNVAYYCIYNNQ